MVFGIALCGAVWYLWGKYEEMSLFIHEAGFVWKFALWKKERQRAKRIKKGACPDHNYPLSPGEKCFACKYVRPSGRKEKS